MWPVNWTQVHPGNQILTPRFMAPTDEAAHSEVEVLRSLLKNRERRRAWGAGGKLSICKTRSMFHIRNTEFIIYFLSKRSSGVQAEWSQWDHRLKIHSRSWRGALIACGRMISCGSAPTGQRAQGGCLHCHAWHKPVGSLTTLGMSESRQTKQVGVKIKYVSRTTETKAVHVLSTESSLFLVRVGLLRSPGLPPLFGPVCVCRDMKVQLSLI